MGMEIFRGRLKKIKAKASQDNDVSVLINT